MYHFVSRALEDEMFVVATYWHFQNRGWEDCCAFCGHPLKSRFKQLCLCKINNKGFRIMCTSLPSLRLKTIVCLFTGAWTDVLTKHRNILLSCCHDIVHFRFMVTPRPPVMSYTEPIHCKPTNTGRHNNYITDYGDFIVNRFNIILYIQGSVWCQSLSYTHTFTSYACTKVKLGKCLMDCATDQSTVFFSVSRRKMDELFRTNSIFSTLFSSYFLQDTWRNYHEWTK